MSNARIRDRMSVRTIIQVLSDGERKVSDFLVELIHRNVDPSVKLQPLFDLDNKKIYGVCILEIYYELCSGSIERFVHYLQSGDISDDL